VKGATFRRMILDVRTQPRGRLASPGAAEGAALDLEGAATMAIPVHTLRLARQ
jgi:hypothetical protein